MEGGKGKEWGRGREGGRGRDEGRRGEGESKLDLGSTANLYFQSCSDFFGVLYYLSK